MWAGREGNARSFSRRRALVARQSVWLAPLLQKASAVEKSLTVSVRSLCSTTSLCSHPGDRRWNYSVDESLKRGYPLTGSSGCAKISTNMAWPAKPDKPFIVFFFIFLENTLFEHFAASIYFPSSVFFPLILSLTAKRPNQTAALFGTKLSSWDDRTRSLLSLWRLRARAACGGSRRDCNPGLSWDESQARAVSKASCSRRSPCQDTSVLLSVLPPVLLSLRKRYEIHI